MTITTLLPTVAGVQLSLDSFRDCATNGETLQVVQDGSCWKVEACGITAAGALGSGTGVDTAALFADALGRAFTRAIQNAVVRELGLASKPGVPLESRLVLQAIAMAQTSQQALQGVDFMTQLMLSAAAQSVGFVQGCRDLGLPPEAISTAQRAAIDVCMQLRFAQAAQQGQFPVAQAVAEQWLRAELAALPVQASGAR